MAAKAQGFGPLRIIFRHVLPNAVTPVYVVATLGIGGAILTESALSFLGIGVQPPTPSWGNILTQAKDNIEVAWWLSVYPGLAIFLTVMGYNLLGEGLQQRQGQVVDGRITDVFDGVPGVRLPGPRKTGDDQKPVRGGTHRFFFLLAGPFAGLGP